MMFKLLEEPRYRIKLDGTYIDMLPVSKIHIISDIEECLPILTFSIKDPQGTILNKFTGLSIGTKIEIEVTETFSDDRGNKADEIADKSEITALKVSSGGGTSADGLITAFTTFYVASFSDIIDETGKMTGEIQFVCVHKWSAIRDYTNHLYSSMFSNSDIIKALLTTSRVKFNPLTNFLKFSNADKNGSTPRYKCCIDDYSFITEKVMPYTTIGGLPAFFWIDDKNNVCLRNFNEMYSQSSKVLFTNGNSQRNLELADTIAMKATMTDSGKKLDIFSASIRVGDKDPIKFFENLKSQIFMELNAHSGACASGEMKARYVIREKLANAPFNPQKPTGNTLPINSMFLNFSSEPTGIKMCRNKSFDDQQALLKNSQKIMYSLFNMEILTDYCGCYLTSGDCVDIMTDPIKDTKFDTMALNTKQSTDKDHWIDGKWVVRRVEHELMDENDPLSRPISRLVLIRPSFVYYDLSTSIDEGVLATLEEVVL